MEIHDVFDDHIYFHAETKEVLRFRLGRRLFINFDSEVVNKIK